MPWGWCFFAVAQHLSTSFRSEFLIIHRAHVCAESLKLRLKYLINAQCDFAMAKRKRPGKTAHTHADCMNFGRASATFSSFVNESADADAAFMQERYAQSNVEFFSGLLVPVCALRIYSWSLEAMLLR
jgi:hypothetical protein